MKTNRWTRAACTLALTTGLALLLAGGTANARPGTSCFSETRLVNGAELGVASLYTYIRVSGKPDYPIVLKGVRPGTSGKAVPKGNIRAEHIAMLLCIDPPQKAKAKKKRVLQLIVPRYGVPSRAAIKKVNVLLGSGKYGAPSAQAVIHFTNRKSVIRPFRPADPKACDEDPDNPGLVLWGGNTLPFVHFRLKNGTTQDEVASAKARGHMGPVNPMDDIHSMPPPTTPPAATDYETSTPDKTHAANWAEVCVVVLSGPEKTPMTYYAEIVLPDPRCRIEHIELDMADGSGGAPQIEAAVFTYMPDPPNLPCGGQGGEPLVVVLRSVKTCGWQPDDYNPYPHVPVPVPK